MTELKDQLSLLGRKTEYKQDYAPEVLEAFDNKHLENDYWVRFNCPEFTSLCPITGQPDFAEIRISYIPEVKMHFLFHLSPDRIKHLINRHLSGDRFIFQPITVSITYHLQLLTNGYCIRSPRVSECFLA